MLILLSISPDVFWSGRPARGKASQLKSGFTLGLWLPVSPRFWFRADGDLCHH